MTNVRTVVAFTAMSLALVACDGNHHGTGPSGTTIEGLAMDRTGDPIAGATVLVEGKSAVTTSSDGRFFVSGVAVPYDIAVLPAGRTTAVAYAGLMRPDPKLVYPFFNGAQKTATIGGAVPPTSGAVNSGTFLFFVSGRYVSGGATADPTTGTYSFTVAWNGASDTQAGRLHMFQWTSAGALPTTFDAYASKTLTISAGGSYNGNDFAPTDLIDPPEQTISGTVSVPSGYTQTVRRLWVFFDHIPVYWQESGSLGSAFSYTVPAISGVTFGVSAEAQDPSSRSSFFVQNGITGNATGVTIPLQASGQLSLPADGALGVDTSTVFSWVDGGGNGVDFVFVTPNDPSNIAFLVLTSTPHMKIPSVGMALPAAAGYQWRVDRVFPLASPDSAASAALLDLTGWEPDHVGETLSETFAFTTKGPAGTADRRSRVGATKTAPPIQPWRGLIGSTPGIRVNSP